MPDFDMPASGTWEQRGGWVVRALMRDLGLSIEQAGGFVGNLGFESASFTELHEIGLPEDEGGIGWPQWTGRHPPNDRRARYEQWCAAQGLDWRSDEANYGYILVELRGAFAGMVERLRECATVERATFLVGEEYERPADTTATHLPGYDERLYYARRAVEGAKAMGVLPTSTPPDTLTQTALDGAGKPYAPDPISLIRHAQTLLGVEPDGDPGPATRAAVRAWREAHP